MKEDKILDAIISIISKELKNIQSVLPLPDSKDLIDNLKPNIEKALGSAGYISKSKYESLKSKAEKLEKRLDKLEEIKDL